MTKRKLFCEISPLCYQISTWKCQLRRTLRDAFKREKFACAFATSPLPCLIYKHKSLIRRKLGNIDLHLQDNKATNLALATPKMTGILIRPNETFSFWRLVGSTSARKGYKEGLMIKHGEPSRGIGGGLCQFSNLLHWIVLHSPFIITEHHHHDGIDMFPDYGRQLPFGVGTSISYNYLDYRFRNPTSQTFQLIVWTDDLYLCGELRAEKPLDVKYHIHVEDESFTEEEGVWFRNNRIFRSIINKSSGKEVSPSLLLKTCHARVLYDPKLIPSQLKQ